MAYINTVKIEGAKMDPSSTFTSTIGLGYPCVEGYLKSVLGDSNEIPKKKIFS